MSGVDALGLTILENAEQPEQDWARVVETHSVHKPGDVFAISERRTDGSVYVNCCPGGPLYLKPGKWLPADPPVQPEPAPWWCGDPDCLGAAAAEMQAAIDRGDVGTVDDFRASEAERVRAEEGRDEPEPGAWKVGDRFTIVDAEGELDVTEGREYVVILPLTKLVWCYDDANDLHAFFPHQVSFIDDAAGPAPVPVDPPQPAGSPWKQGDRVRVLPIAQWSSFIGREIYVEHAATDGTFKALINGEPWWFADEEVEAVDPQAETVSDTVTIEVPRAAAIVYANDFKGDVYDWKHPYESFRAACRAALGADQ
jgi:hypothetical protein